MAHDATSRGPSAFPPTRRSILERVRSTEPAVRRQAFDTIARSYWNPIYKYLRIKWGLPRADAQDITQGFLATAYDKEYFDSFDPLKARFRTFLRTCVDRFATKWRKAERAQKRGGGTQKVSLDFESAEGEMRELQIAADIDTEEFFRRESIRFLFARSVEQLRAELESKGKTLHYRLFERYDLGSEDDLTYADLARDSGLSVTQVTNYLATTRRTFRQVALRHLREASGTEDEFRADARELFGVDV